MTFKEYAKEIMYKVKQVLGADVSVNSAKNELNEITTYVVSIENELWNDTTTYTTIGLLIVDTGYFYNGKPLVSELIGVVKSEYTEYPNMLGSIVTNTKSFLKPSVEKSIHLDIISEYYPEVTMKHVVLSQSMFWDDLYYHDMGDTIVTWLTPLPISDSELQYLNQKGLDALLTLFENKSIDISDINRESVV